MKKAIQRTEFIQQAYTHVKLNFNHSHFGKTNAPLPVLNETVQSKGMKKVILNKQNEEEKNKLRLDDSINLEKGLQQMGETAIKNDEDLHVQKGEAPVPRISSKQEIPFLQDNGLKKLDMRIPSLTNLANAGSNKSINSKMVEIDDLIDSPHKATPNTKAMILSSTLAFRNMRSGGNVIVIKSCVEGKDAKKVFGQLV